MKTHADVHLEMRRMLHGTRLTSFMVTTNSFEDESGCSVEWCVTVSSGRNPEFYFRARDPDRLIEEARAGIARRRPFFDAPLGPLELVDGPPPQTSAVSR
jgi:hypothetical protein